MVLHCVNNEAILWDLGVWASLEYIYMNVCCTLLWNCNIDISIVFIYRAQTVLHNSSVPHCAWENKLTCSDLKEIDVFPVKPTDLLKLQISHSCITKSHTYNWLRAICSGFVFSHSIVRNSPTGLPVMWEVRGLEL